MGMPDGLNFCQPPDGKDKKEVSTEYKTAWNRMGTVMPSSVREIAVSESAQVFMWNNYVASSVDVSVAIYQWRTWSRVGWIYFMLLIVTLVFMSGLAHYFMV